MVLIWHLFLNNIKSVSVGLKIKIEKLLKQGVVILAIPILQDSRHVSLKYFSQLKKEIKIKLPPLKKILLSHWHF